MNPYTDNLEATQARILSLENEMCDNCRKKAGLAPKAKAHKLKPASETKKKLRLMGVISFYAAAAFAIFWGIWSIFAPVPVITEIVWSKNIVWHLPFTVSRWWDAAFAPLYGAAISSVVLFAKPWLINKYPDKKEDIVDGLAASLVVGLAASLVVGLAASLVVGLVVGLGWLIKKTVQAFFWFIAFNKKIFKI